MQHKIMAVRLSGQYLNVPRSLRTVAGLRGRCILAGSGRYFILCNLKAWKKDRRRGAKALAKLSRDLGI